MAKIRLLDEDTINKIAAGEVIERPASVVKELVENSIDANAGRVLIEVKEGGKSFIKITDDGCGMEAEDLTLAFQKHATSKIRDAGDLEKIATLGFRGEALASIASVSAAIEVRTKTRDSLSGTYLRLENGKIAEKKEIGCPVGTSITVWDLFYNVPARRKHLKGAEAELVHITDIITELAIIHFDIAFDLFTGKRTLFKSAKSDSWDDVLLRLFGLKTLQGMAALQAEGRGWSISGVVGDALSLRSSPDRIFIFVNGRAVSSKAIATALRDAYRNIIPLGKSPMAVISLEISPELVDVNVHPAKREIRLMHEDEISSVLFQRVAEALANHAKPAVASSGELGEQSLADPGTFGTIAQSYEQSTLPIDMTEMAPAEAMPPNKERPKLTILGQILKLYIVAAGEQGLVLVDQHAAAERIRFERLTKLYRSRSIRQELAEPIAIELSPSEKIMISSWQETLEDIGFEFSPFGGNTYSVRAVPALGRRLESAEAVHDILRDLFLRGKVGPDSTNRDDILKLLACRGSIKSGKELTVAEMNRLLQDLGECDNPLTCPHGRPVMVVIDQNQLERLFARR
jgi:DNA mismatch repair protein MutL